MKTEPGGDSSHNPPPRKMGRFAPKIPPRKVKPVVPKSESEVKDDIINKDLLSKLNNVKNEGFERRWPKVEKNLPPLQASFGLGGNSMYPRSFGKTSGGSHGAQSSSKTEDVYEEPWDYYDTNYPITLPLRRPYSGDPELLDKAEFAEAPTTSASHADNLNHAEYFGLLGNDAERQMMFFQLPPLPFQTPHGGKNAAGHDAGSSLGVSDTKGKGSGDAASGSGIKDLPAGLVGKMLVYKSGAVKMKIGDTIFDVSPGSDCVFAQDVVAINAQEKHCCRLGDVGKRAIVTPDIKSMLSSLGITGDR